jgi:hypothetical protein
MTACCRMAGRYPHSKMGCLPSSEENFFTNQIINSCSRKACYQLVSLYSYLLHNVSLRLSQLVGYLHTGKSVPVFNQVPHHLGMWGGSLSTPPCIHEFSTRWWWVISFKPNQLCPRRKDLHIFQLIEVSCLKNKVTLVHAMKAYEESGESIQLILTMALDGMSC